MTTVGESVLPIDPVTETATVEPPEDSPVAKSSAVPKEAKTKKVPAPRKRTSPTHPPYLEMIKDAIVTLKDRTGSSQYAITKFIEDKQKALPSNFRKVLLLQLKKLVANDKLVKVKSSFKLPSARSAKPASDAPVTKKSISVRKPKPKAAAPAKAKKASGVSKPKPKAVKSKAVVVKAKAAAKAASPKRKAPEKSKAEKKPAAKVAKTATRSTPRKAAALKKKVPLAPVKKTPAKSVKPKSMKSPARKKAVGKRGKK